MESAGVPQISRVAVKPPPFWKNNPTLWFAQLEAQFAIANVSANITKYYYVISTIESDILESVHDLVTKPPENNKYDTIKKRLIDIYSESQTSKLRTLLQGLELGDQRPSHLLTKMRDLANGHFSEDLLKSLWLRRLPGNIQAILAASNESLPQLATMADKIHELTIINHTPISQQEQFSISNPIEKQIQELTLQVNELATLVRTPRYQHRPRYNFRNRQDPHGRSPSRERRRYKEPEGGLCFYHTNFGANAKKCTPP
ncbi:uncharacterized protein LOC111631739 [Centruroides sculpturatus]|uniref:uncharacterized protein LOC111631739 n=1 Tax=Centruroides sculpturatus TaxID=218467 RepID=UPI000C6E9980|nr:uncharacterized protein LOC111631739 [Centruroides sculpturatus]